MERTFAGYVLLCKKKGVVDLQVVPPAPAEYWKMFGEAEPMRESPADPFRAEASSPFR